MQYSPNATSLPPVLQRRLYLKYNCSARIVHIPARSRGFRRVWSLFRLSNSSSKYLVQCAAVRGQPERVSPSEITLLIKEAVNFQSLRSVVQDYEQELNFIHAAAAFTHAAQLTQQLLLSDDQQQQQQHRQELQSVLPLLLQAVQQQRGNFQGRQVANCLWAANKLLQALAHQQQQQQESDAAAEPLQQQMLLVIQQLLQQTQYCWHLFTGQELVLLLYAASTMPAAAAAAVATGTAADSSSSSSSRSSGTTAQAIMLSEQLQPNVDQHHQQQQQHHGDAESSVSIVNLVWANKALQLLQRLHRSNKLRVKPQEFEMLLISIRRLQQQQQQQPQLQVPLALLQQLLAAAASNSHKCSSRDIAGLLYSFAALRIKPSNNVIKKLLTPLKPGSKTLRSCKPVDVTNILYALAVLGVKPWQQQQQQQEGNQDNAWLALRGLVMQLLQQRKQFSAPELTVCIYELGRLRARLPAAAVAAVAAAAVQGLMPQQQQELVLLCHGLGGVGAKVSPVLLQAILGKFVAGAAAAAGGGGAAAAAAETTDLHLHQQQRRQQSDMAAQHVSVLLWALGRLQYCPPQRLLLPLLQSSQLLLQYAAPEHLACICWGLARVGVRPSEIWLSGFYQQLMWLAGQQNPGTGGIDAGAQHDTTEGFSAGSSNQGFAGTSSTGFTSSQVSGFSSHMQNPSARESVKSGLNGQVLAMILWGLVQMQVTVHQQPDGESAAVAAASDAAAVIESDTPPRTTVSDMLHHVTSLSHNMLQSSPLSVGVILWGCVKLGLKPSVEVLQSALQSFMQNPQHQQGKHQGHREASSWQQQQRQRQQQWSVQQQQRYGQSLALTIWSLARLGATGEQKQQLLQVLWANTQQVRNLKALDLSTIIWGLNKLQSQPPIPWLLNFYISTQSQFDDFTDVRLASLVLPLYELLQRQPGRQDDRQQQQIAGQVPPAVWQLQLELQVQSRWKRRRRKDMRRRGSNVAEDEDSDVAGQVQDGAAGQQLVQGQYSRRRAYDPLSIVARVLKRWKAVSLGSSRAAPANQLTIQREPAVA